MKQLLLLCLILASSTLWAVKDVGEESACVTFDPSTNTYTVDSSGEVSFEH